jgi:hypothetical protein
MCISHVLPSQVTSVRLEVADSRHDRVYMYALSYLQELIKAQVRRAVHMQYTSRLSQRALVPVPGGMMVRHRRAHAILVRMLSVASLSCVLCVMRR